jgi:hypothetical protein
MAHWPKTVYGNVLLFLVALGVAQLLVSLLVVTSPWGWSALAVAAIAGVGLVGWRRRIEAARERAWVGAFSFGDVVARRRAEEASRIAAE